ncbi:MAG: hypothetical protein PVH88_14910 [Ignavibacteria bacterium]|jgi:hypothetical protein
MNSQLIFTAWNDYYKGIKTLGKKNSQENFINYLENLVNLIKSNPSIKVKKEDSQKGFSGKCLKLENENCNLGCIVAVPITENLDEIKCSENLQDIIKKNGNVILSNYYKFLFLKNDEPEKSTAFTSFEELENKNSEMNLECMEKANQLFEELLSN